MHIGGFARTQPPTDPYGPLYPRPIAQLGGTWKTPATVQVEALDGLVDPAIGSPVKRVEAAVGFPVSTTAQAEHLPLSMDVPAGGTARLILDMGGIVSGLVEFELDAPAGTVFDLSYVEEPVTGPAGMIAQHAGTRYIARGEHDRLRGVRLRTASATPISWSMALQGTVTLQHFAVREQVYPWQEGAGFACDDEELNRIFHGGRAHGAAQLARRLYRLPHPRAARLGRRQRRAPDGAPRNQPGLAAGLALPDPEQLAPLRRHVADGVVGEDRGQRRPDHPGLGAALDSRRLQLLPLQRRPRYGQDADADLSSASCAGMRRIRHPRACSRM